jgi:ribosomal protein S18 acetylase RimI-like enzyme
MILGATQEDHQAIQRVWWRSVQNSHPAFIPQDYLLRLWDQFPTFLEHVDLYKYVLEPTDPANQHVHPVDERGDEMAAFMGVSRPADLLERILQASPKRGRALEMLFVDPAYMRQGIGRQLVRHAIHHLHVSTVCVNEQNKAAVDFYLRNGFPLVLQRSEVDAAGEPYPTLTLGTESCDLDD